MEEAFPHGVLGVLDRTHAVFLERQGGCGRVGEESSVPNGDGANANGGEAKRGLKDVERVAADHGGEEQEEGEKGRVGAGLAD